MNLTNIKAVIFDMDGVLIDSEGVWKQAEKEVFSSLGVKVTDELAKETQSMTTDEVAHFWFDQFPWQNTSIAEAEQKVIKRVSDLISTEDCLISGVKPFIKKLSSLKLKIGLATNSPAAIIPTVLKKIGIENLFDIISSAEFEERGKPDPAIYLSTAKKLKTKVEECLVIEDSQSGILAAKRAGMTVAVFTNGNPQNNSNNADFSFDSFETICNELITNKGTYE